MRIAAMSPSLLYCFIYFFFFFFFVYKVSAKTFQGDVAALQQIKSAIIPASIQQSSCVGSWDFAYDPCDRSSSEKFICGLSCDSTNPSEKRIIELTLDQASYSGILSPFLANLSVLEALDFSGNSFTGIIPSEIGKLSKLIRLDFSSNSLQGAIPESISNLASLRYFSVAYNSLTGSLPSSLNLATNLERIYVQNNRISGYLPNLRNLKQLMFLDASENAIVGKVSLFSRLPPNSLVHLSLRNNLLHGILSPENKMIAQFTSLEVLDLHSNNFTGAIPAALFLLPNLQQLTLSNNNFIALQSPPISNIDSRLVAFDASYNAIDADLPVFFAGLQRLSSLALRYNRFKGVIPNDYAEKVAAGGKVKKIDTSSSSVLPLARLLLDGNFLTGELPPLFLKPLPNLIAASFAYNCLNNCLPKYPFCQGSQRPSMQCRRN